MDTENKPEQIDAPAKKPFSRSAPGILLRLLLTGIAGTLIGAVVYYTAIGWIPYLDQRVFQPIDNNQAQVEELRRTQQMLETQISGLLGALASNQVLIDEGIGIYQATLTYLDSELNQVVNDTRLIQSSVDNNTKYMLQYTQSLATFEAKLDSNTNNLSALATAQMSNYGIKDDLVIIKILESFSRTGQFLLHDNYGLAEDELKSARDTLLSLQNNLSGGQLAYLVGILDLVDQMISDLPTQPIQAANKLQIAWQLAFNGLPQTQSGTITPTLHITPSITPTPSQP